MSQILVLGVSVALLGGCDAKKPAADLRYVKLYPVSARFAVEFDSSRNFESIYSKGEVIISKRFICPLENDRIFDVGHKLRYVYRGNFELQRASRIRNEVSYRYVSHGNFYEYPPESNDYKLLAGRSLGDVIGNKKSIPCKVIMTVYMHPAYYSGEMSLPTDDIFNAANIPK